MGRLKSLLTFSIFQLCLSSLNSQEQKTFDLMGSSEVCPLNIESLKGQLTNSDHKIEKSLDEKTAEILEQMKKNDVKANLGVYETFIENTIDKKLLSLQAKSSSGTIEVVHLITMIINEKFSKMEKSVEIVNNRLTKMEESLISSAKERSLLIENVKKIGEAVVKNVKTEGIPDCLANQVALKILSTGKYHYRAIRMNWYAAKEYCEKLGMQLVTINTKEEAKAVVEARIGNTYDLYWTSATDIGRTPGQFYWADGQPTERWIWNSKEPDNHGPGKEACAVLLSSFDIGDMPCSSSYPLICELHPSCKNKI